MASKADKQWWNNLDKDWKEELVRNLLDSPKYKKRNLVLTDIYEQLNESAEIITEIVNIEKLHLSWIIIMNDPELLFKFKKINDFLILPPDWDDLEASFLNWYPEHLRSKVRRLDLDGIIFNHDLSPLSDFTNLEVLNCRDCQIESLEGIQNLTKLKIFKADQGNSYSDLNPLRGLNLVSLNIQSTKVTDISPLIDLSSLEWVDLGFLSINDLSPLLKLPNLGSVIVPANIEIQKDKLEEYLINYQHLDKGVQDQLISGPFDVKKSWYLIPFYPFDEFTGSLYEGRVIDNETDFNSSNSLHPISGIKIADSINICRELRDPIIYRVKIGKETHLSVDKAHGHFWYASKVKLLKPVHFWDLLPSVNPTFKGNINLCHQPFLPDGLVLPKIIKGNLLFWDCTLPETINLPEIIEGSLEISDCVIPHEWSNNYPLEVGNLRLVQTRLEMGTVLPKKIYGDIDFHRLTEFEDGVVMPDSYLSVTAELTDFPADFKLLNTKLKTLTFEECNLPTNFKVPEAYYNNMIFTGKTIPVGLKWPQKYTGNLTFVASVLPSGFKFPKEFDGILVLKDMLLTKDLQLPASFSGILELRNVQISDGFKLPSMLSGKLKISNSEIIGCLHLPTNEGYDFELNKGSNLSDFEIPEAVLPRLKLLPSWY